jgi:DNA replication protein DnaC
VNRIDETLKKIAENTTKASSESSSNTEPARTTVGDPNCPFCHGVGFVRQDLPIDHPDFGRLQICVCRQQAVQNASQKRLFHLSNLDALDAMTFETFKVEGRSGLADNQIQSLQIALSAARQYAANLNGWLLLMGGYGSGKTHLAAAIANFAVSLGVPALLLTVPDLLDWLRFSYDSTESSFEQRFEEIRSIRLLVLDDLGTQNATPWAQEKLFQIMNTRYINRLPTVITTNLELDEIEGRIRSRLEDDVLVNRVMIAAPDFRSPMREGSSQSLSTLHHHVSQVFGEFNFREPEKLTADQQNNLRKAFHLAHDFAENPHGWMVLLGSYGTGKTHLAAAIGNYRHSLGDEVMFVVVPDLLDHLRATFGPDSSISYDRLFDQVRNAQILILDDLGTQSATPWAREKLYQIFNYRYNTAMPTVITSSDKLEDIDPRIRSRMLDRRICNIFSLDVPAYRPSTGPAEKPARKPRKTSER